MGMKFDRFYNMAIKADELWMFRSTEHASVAKMNWAEEVELETDRSSTPTPVGSSINLVLEDLCYYHPVWGKEIAEVLPPLQDGRFDQIQASNKLAGKKRKFKFVPSDNSRVNIKLNKLHPGTSIHPWDKRHPRIFKKTPESAQESKRAWVLAKTAHTAGHRVCLSTSVGPKTQKKQHTPG